MFLFLFLFLYLFLCFVLFVLIREIYENERREAKIKSLQETVFARNAQAVLLTKEAGEGTREGGGRREEGGGRRERRERREGFVNRFTDVYLRRGSRKP